MIVAQVLINNYYLTAGMWQAVSAPDNCELISIEFINNNADTAGLLISKTDNDVTNAALYSDKGGAIKQARAQYNTYGTAVLQDTFFIAPTPGDAVNVSVIMVVRIK